MENQLRTLQQTPRMSLFFMQREHRACVQTSGFLSGQHIRISVLLKFLPQVNPLQTQDNLEEESQAYGIKQLILEHFQQHVALFLGKGGASGILEF